jgi:hypothetical protein
MDAVSISETSTRLLGVITQKAVFILAAVRT